MPPSPSASVSICGWRKGRLAHPGDITKGDSDEPCCLSFALALNVNLTLIDI